MTSCGDPCACLCLKGPFAALSHTWHAVLITALTSADSSVKGRLMVSEHDGTSLGSQVLVVRLRKLFYVCRWTETQQGRWQPRLWRPGQLSSDPAAQEAPFPGL